ncbi:MAG TPA: Lrp/AsnC ligand binding domain-containing protein [Anaeromyxobacteraceae bacterium]
MKAAFVLVKCELGRVTEVARAIIEIDGVSEVHSVTGEHDLLVKLYADDYEAFGDLITNRLQRVAGLRETVTMLAYRAFGGGGE